MSWGEVFIGLVLLGGYFFFKKIREEVRMDEARQRYEETMKQHREWEMQEGELETAAFVAVADDESSWRQREARERRELQEIYDRLENPDFDAEADLYMDSLLDDSHDEWDIDLYGDSSDGWNDDIGSGVGSMDYGSAEGGGFWD